MLNNACLTVRQQKSWKDMHLSHNESSRAGKSAFGKWTSVALQGGGLLVFWVALSGRLEARFLLMGALSATAVLVLNRDIFFHQILSEEKSVARAVLVSSWRWLSYLTWLLYSVVVANIQVAYLVLHPRMPISPALLRFTVPWPKALTRVLLANSITLTPGTVTVDLQDGQYTVHTLAVPLAQSLVSGNMQKKVASVFKEEAPTSSDITWIKSVGDLKP